MAAAAKQYEELVCFLRIEKGINEYRQQLQKLANIAWHIAYTALWNGQSFSIEEKQKALDAITSFINEGKSPSAAFSQLVQRVLLARQYVNTHPGKWVPAPAVWFSNENKNGFLGTERWLKDINTHRASKPSFKFPLLRFSTAVLQTIDAVDATVYHDWRNFFISHHCQGLLNLYLAVLANYYCGSDDQ